MKNLTTRRILIIVLIILTIGLGALSVYVGLNLNKEDVAPDDSSADTTLGCWDAQVHYASGDEVYAAQTFSSGSTNCENLDIPITTCSNQCQKLSGQNTGLIYSCSGGKIIFFEAPETCPTSNVTSCSNYVAGQCILNNLTLTGGTSQCAGTLDGKIHNCCPSGQLAVKQSDNTYKCQISATTGGSCVIDNPSVTDSYIDINSSCNNSLITNDYRFSGTATDKNGDGDITSQDCVGTSTNRTDLNATIGNRYTPNPSCGQCEQIDIVYNGREYGTAKYGGDCSTPPPVPPSSSTPTATFACINGTGSATISWQALSGDNSNTEYRISIGTDTDFGDDTGFWRKIVTGVTSTTAPAGFNPVAPINYALPLTPLTRFYVRVFNATADEVYPIVNFVAQSCTTPIVPGCGETCTSTTQCPTNHVCDTTTDTCVLSQCVNNNPECLQNGCALPLPDTAIFGEKYDKLMFGVMMILLGILMVKVDVMGGLLNYVNDIELSKKLYKRNTLHSGIEKRVKKTRKQFEKKFIDKTNR